MLSPSPVLLSPTPASARFPTRRALWVERCYSSAARRSPYLPQRAKFKSSGLQDLQDFSGLTCKSCPILVILSKTTVTAALPSINLFDQRPRFRSERAIGFESQICIELNDSICRTGAAQ